MGKGSGICDDRGALLAADAPQPTAALAPFTLQDLHRKVGLYEAMLPNGESIAWGHEDYDDKNDYMIDGHYAPGGSPSFYTHGVENTSHASAYSIGLLYGVKFKSSHALVKAASELVGQQVHYTFRGSLYVAQQDLGDGLSVSAHCQRLDNGWNVNAVFHQAETADKQYSSCCYVIGKHPTRQAGLDRINELASEELINGRWGS